MHPEYDRCNRFEEFAALQFDLEGNALNTLLKYQKEYLKKPLLLMKPSMKYRALRANKLIVDFMKLSSQEEIERHIEGEINESDIQHILSLVNLGCCDRPEGLELRDEIYCQLVKQTTSNPIKSSCCRGVELFLSCLAGFPPSRLLTPYLCAHFHAGFVERAYVSRQTLKLAENCIHALERMNKYGPRRQGITKNEIIVILSRNECLSIKIFINEISMNINIDSWTSMGDLKYAICEKVGIGNIDTSTLTISAVLNASNQSERQEKKVMLASSKGIMHTLYDLLFLEMKYQPSSQQDTKPIWHPLCGRTEDIDASCKTISALNLFLKVDLKRGVKSPDFYTTSHSCLTNEDFYSENISNSPALNTSLFCLPLLCSQSVGNSVTAIDFSNIDLKLKLRICIFPDLSNESGMSLTKSAVSFALPEEENEEKNSSIDIKSQKLFMKDLFKSDSYAKKTKRIDNSLEGICIDSDHWPHDDFMRNILYNQLVSDFIDGSLVCSDNTEILYLAALALGEQNQTRNWCFQERPFFFDKMSDMDKDDILRRILPAILIDMPSHKRKKAADSISKEMTALVTDTEKCIDTQLDSPLGYGIEGYNIDYPEFSTVILKGIQEESGWVAFLYSSVVYLWSLFFEDLTSRECRDLFLRRVRKCTGYGSTVFFPSAVTISVLKELEETESIMKQGKEKSAENIEGVKKPLWITIENEYMSHSNCTSLVMNQQEQAVPFLLESTIMLSVVTEGLILSECIKPIDVIHDSPNNEICQGNRDATIPRVLLKIQFDEIVSWGYNDDLLIIKFTGSDRLQGTRCGDDKETKQVRDKGESDIPSGTLFNDIMACAYGEGKDEGSQRVSSSSDSIPTLCHYELPYQVERCGEDEKGEKHQHILMDERGSQHEQRDVRRTRGGTSLKNQCNYSTISSAFMYDSSSTGLASNETKEENGFIDRDSVTTKLCEDNENEEGKDERIKKIKVIDTERRGTKVQRRRLKEKQRREGGKVAGKGVGDSRSCDSITLTTLEGVEIAELLQLYVSLIKRSNTLKW